MQIRHGSTFVLLLTSILSIGLGMFSQAKVSAKQPNIVMLISDDQSWTDYGFMGHETIKTPHLDKLASQSLTFKRGYVPTSLCRPSLATMITGLYPFQHHVTGNDPVVPQGMKKNSQPYYDLRDQVVHNIDRLPTLPKILGKKGYVSHQSGKWWEGNYSRGGFTAGMTHGDPSKGGRHGDVGLKIGREGMKPVFDFIDSAGDKPFFLWYAPFLPHTPHNPPQRLLEKYTAKDRPIHVARYYAMCDWFDETCGELLTHLDEKGLAENTIVVYVTDNGWIQNPNKGTYAPRSKRSPNEGGTRTPIMIRWPGKVQPKVDDTHLASSIDLVPTILNAVGCEPKDFPKDLQGIDLLDANTVAARHTIYGDIYEHDMHDLSDPNASLKYRWCIHDNLKLIIPNKKRVPNESVQLHDIIKDPHENKDIAKSSPEQVKELTKLIEVWLPSAK